MTMVYTYGGNGTTQHRPQIELAGALWTDYSV